MPRILDQIDVLEVFQRFKSSFGKEHELIAIQLPRYTKKDGEMLWSNSSKDYKYTDIRCNLETGVNTSAGSVVRRLLFKASHNKFGIPTKDSESISFRLLDSMNNFSIRSKPLNIWAGKRSSKLPPMWSSCSCPKLIISSDINYSKLNITITCPKK